MPRCRWWLTIPETFLGVGYTRDRAGLPLEAVRVPVPQPAADQVLIRVAASSLNPLGPPPTPTPQQSSNSTVLEGDVVEATPEVSEGHAIISSEGFEPHRADAQVLQDLHADAVVALVRLESEALVRLHGVEPLLLELVRADLVRDADASPFLIEVKQNAAPCFFDLRHRGVELRTAVAAR